MQMVGDKGLNKWDIEFEELFAAGLEKLRASTPLRFEEQDGYFTGTWTDDYDSSRALLPGLLQELHLNGDPIIVTPNRLTLMVAGSNDTAAVLAMLQRAGEIVQTKARPMNAAPLTYQDGRLQDFRVERNSPLFNPVERARKLAALKYYTEQKNRHEALHEKTGKDIFVASYTLVQDNDTGEYMSYGVWTKTVPTLLPKTDVVFLHDQKQGDPEEVTWDALVRVAMRSDARHRHVPSTLVRVGIPFSGAVEGDGGEGALSSARFSFLQS